MKLGTITSRIRHSVATVGLPHALHDLTLRTANRVVLIKILKCMAIDRVNPAFATCPEPYRPMFLTKPMLREFGRDPANEMPESFLEEALSKGDECFGLLAGETLASYGWYSIGPTRIDPPALVLYPGARSVYMYKGFTHVAHRGRRLHAIGMTLALQEYLDRGFKGLVSYVESNNFSSLSSVVRMGYEVFGTIYVLRLSGVFFTRATAGCRARGLRVEHALPGTMSPAGPLPGGTAPRGPRR
jgi:hypothetical protein